MRTFLLISLLLLAFAPGPARAAFVDNGDTVTDTVTCLEWQKAPMKNGAGWDFTWQDALVVCENLSLAGHTDWRLPEHRELLTLIDRTLVNPAIAPVFLETMVFDLYWSSTPGDYPNLVWVVEFYAGWSGWVDAFPSWGVESNLVRAVRSGQCGTSGTLTIAPSTVAFPSIYLGETSAKSLAVNNSLPQPAEILSTSISGVDSADFSMWDGCSGTALASNGTCKITATFAPRSCGDKNATLTVATSKGNLTSSLSGTACGDGAASLSGTVRNGENLQPLNGASVMVGETGPYLTNDIGKFQANNLAPGTYELGVSRQGYETWRGSITLNPQQAAEKDTKLTPTTSTAHRVTSLTSKYSNGSPYYFLPGISVNVAFTAHVDWGGKAPGKVRFITSRGSYDVATTGTTAAITLDIGTECNACSTLQAVAIAADGSKSVAKNADFIVTTPLPVDPELPLLSNNLAVENSSTSFSYKNNSTLSKNLLDQTIGDYKDIPILKNSATSLSYAPEFDFEFSGAEGKASYSLSIMKIPGVKNIKEVHYSKRKNEHGLKNLYNSLEHFIQEGNIDRRHFPKTVLADFTASLFPVFQGDFSFDAAKCGVPSSGWQPMTGYFGFAGKGEWNAVYQSLLPPPLPPIPYYISPTLGLEFDAMLNLNDAINLRPSGNASTSPYLSGTLGVGVNDVVAVEGAGKGGVDIAWDFPVAAGQNAITDCNAYFEITGRAYFLTLQKQFLTKRWETQDCSGNGAARISAQKLFSPVSQTESTLTLISRDYLQSVKSAAFQDKPIYKEMRFNTAEKSYSVSSSPVVSATFPVSAANLSSAGSYVNLIWLADKPERSAINRTMAVHAAFDGLAWSAPIPIADNDTADFNPSSLTFTDGSIIAAWEDVAIPLADTATLEEMTAQLEISTSLYDPNVQTWGPAVRLTNDLALDRTPKIGGKDKNSVLVTWVSNDQNDISGSMEKPNQLKYALYNGTAWSASMVAAVIPNQVKRYTVVFDGATANVVLALDTDNNPSTLEDLELYRLVYSNGEWGPLTRLTSDTVIDDTPQLSLDSADNVVMTWLKGNELSGVVNFDFDQRTVIRAEKNYTSTLADFKQATTTDGRIALIYADLSENYSSDLYGVFYDPIFKLWGSPKQLTDDAETEQWPSLAFLGTDTIVSTYNRKLLIGADGTPTEGALSDLYMLKHTLTDDLAIEDSLTVDIPNAAPGTAVTLSTNIKNLGDNTAQNITVSFYNGNPAEGGTLIGDVVITDPLKPGDAVTVSLPWTIPEGAAPVNVYVVVDPGSLIDTLNRDNNVANAYLALPDLKLQDFRGEMLAPGHFKMVVSIANIGGTGSAPCEVTFRQADEAGPILGTLALPALQRFASVDLAFEWKPDSFPSSFTVVALVDETSTITETNEYNNIGQLTLSSTSGLLGDVNGDRVVNLQDAVICLQVLTGLSPANLNRYASVSGDGKIGMAEVNYILQSTKASSATQ